LPEGKDVVYVSAWVCQVTGCTIKSEYTVFGSDKGSRQ